MEKWEIVILVIAIGSIATILMYNPDTAGIRIEFSGYLLSNGSIPLTGNWNTGNYNITASWFKGNIVLTRMNISDLWNTPFWSNIPDKPSTFTPSSHIHDALDIISGVFASARIPTLSLSVSNITSGTFNLSYIPVIDDAHIPNIETLSYGGVFNIAQIPWTLIPNTGIVIGGDTNLYRSGADVLKTDDYLVIGQAIIPTWTRHLIPEYSDIYNLGSGEKEWVNLYIGTGKIYLGLAQDVNLYRSAANALKTDDSFETATGLTANFGIFTSSDDTILRNVDSSTFRLGGGSAYNTGSSIMLHGQDDTSAGNLDFIIGGNKQSDKFGIFRFYGRTSSGIGSTIAEINSDGSLYLASGITAIAGIFTSGVTTQYISGDYGLTWTDISLPSGTNGQIFVAYNSNDGVLASRYYAYSNGAWHYMALT